mgnify:CR=1 FL=1
MGLEKVKMIDLPRITDPRGNLSVVQGGSHIPFDIRRVFYLYDVPGGATRGGHAHHREQQVLIAVSGSFDVELDDGHEKMRVTLNRPFRGVLIPPGVWRELDNFSSGSVCLTLSSIDYDESDYIRDYETFKRLSENGQI